MRNHWFSVVRKHKVRANAHAQLANEPWCDVGLIESRLVYRQLARAWSRLPAQSRSIARHCLLDGHSQEEASRTLGMTAGGIAASIHRTRRTLRQEMLGLDS